MNAQAYFGTIEIRLTLADKFYLATDRMPEGVRPTNFILLCMARAATLREIERQTMRSIYADN